MINIGDDFFFFGWNLSLCISVLNFITDSTPHSVYFASWSRWWSWNVIPLSGTKWHCNRSYRVLHNPVHTPRRPVYGKRSKICETYFKISIFKISKLYFNKRKKNSQQKKKGFFFLLLFLESIPYRMAFMHKSKKY